MDQSELEEAARLLRRAEADAIAIPPLSRQFAEITLEDSYSIQLLNHRYRTDGGQRRSGWKVGLATAAVRRQLGINERDAGALFDIMAARNGGDVDISSLIQPRVEAEIAFVLGDDLPVEAVTPIDVMRATAFVVPAIEIVDSRIVDWDLTLFDTVADNASAAKFALGTVPRSLMGLDFSAVEMALSIDGSVVTGGKADAYDSPVDSIVWLANFLAERGQALQAGEIVLAGSFDQLIDINAGQTVEASFTGLGSVIIDLVLRDELNAPTPRARVLHCVGEG